MDSDEIVASIKRRISIPENQSTFTYDEILAVANEEMLISVVPSILKLHEDFFLFDSTQDLEASVSAYAIPYRAIGQRLYDVQYLDENDNYQEMTRISKGDRPDYQGAGDASVYTFYIDNNNIVLIPSVGTTPTGSLVMTYYLRPSRLVNTNRLATITAINTSTGAITCSGGIPTHFTTSLTYDLCMVNSPHRPLAIDLTASAVSTVTDIITFTAADLPDTLAVGDHVIVATECCIPQIPSDLHVALVQRACEVITEAQGDGEGLKNNKIRNAQMDNATGTMLDSRIDSSPRKIVNSKGFLGRKGLKKNY